MMANSMASNMCVVGQQTISVTFKKGRQVVSCQADFVGNFWSLFTWQDKPVSYQ